MTVLLTGSGLTVEEVVRIAREAEPVELDPTAIERMLETRRIVERVVERGDVVYGMTTGVGARKKVLVAPEEIPAFNRALIANHRVGTGPDAPVDIVRATVVRLANALAKGTAGLRPEIAQRLVDALNNGDHPRVRMLGSVGQADLPQTADLAHGLTEDEAVRTKVVEVRGAAFAIGRAAERKRLLRLNEREVRARRPRLRSGDAGGELVVGDIRGHARAQPLPFAARVDGRGRGDDRCDESGGGADDSRVVRRGRGNSGAQLRCRARVAARERDREVPGVARTCPLRNRKASLSGRLLVFRLFGAARSFRLPASLGPSQ